MLSGERRTALENELRSAWVNADQTASLIKQAQLALRSNDVPRVRQLLEQATQPSEFAACHVRWAQQKVGE